MIRRLIRTSLGEVREGEREAIRLALRDVAGRGAQEPADRITHLQGTLGWLKRAQDVTGCGGVARSYCVAKHHHFGSRGWLAAYPETTGYLIPTIFDCAALLDDNDLYRRAVSMAEWEVDVQMPSGAVQGGMITAPPAPAIFNTGQVIFGWLRAAGETGESRFLDAAERAGRFLVQHQDEDGAWRRALSKHAKAGPQTYNVRCAWAMLQLADMTGNAAYRESGIRNVEWAMSSQAQNGWFSGNCLDDDEAPLSHTTAYATRGVLESGIVLGDERFVAAAKKAADALMESQRSDGSLPGRHDSSWKAAAPWTCLTGNAQVAIIWMRLAAILGEDAYRVAAEQTFGFLARLQDLQSTDPGVRGGVAGSYPIYGDYGTFEYLNWAAKFFADLIVQLERAEVGVGVDGNARRLGAITG